MKKEKKPKKKMSKRKKIIILIIIILIIIGGVFAYTKFFTKTSTPEAKENIVDSIDSYGYTISDTDTKLFKTKFEELKKVLKQEEIDTEKYSKLVSQLFIIDFFTLDNKVTKNDVGGVQFVYDNYKTSFIDKARDEFYKYVKNNLNNDRNQDLPVVSSIKVNKIEKIEASDALSTDEFKNITDAYKVDLTWEYEEDLGYETSAKVIIVKDGDKKFSVAKLISDDEETDSTN